MAEQELQGASDFFLFFFPASFRGRKGKNESLTS